MNKKQFRDHMKSIRWPKGFTGEFREKMSWDGKTKKLEFVLSKPDDITIRFDQEGGGGHTEFKVNGVMASFDRLGVSDSFYYTDMSFDSKTKPKVRDLNKIVEEQLAKIEKSRDYYKTAIKIPEIGFTVSPDRVEQLKSNLKTQGVIRFYPSGFGTGYAVSKKPLQRLRYGEKRASTALEKFLGAAPLYVSTMDCD